MNKRIKRFLSLGLGLLLTVTLLTGLVLHASAAGLTGLTDSSIGLDYTAATNSGTAKWSAAGTKVEGSVQGALGAYYKQSTSTLTIKNNKDTAASLTFDYAITTTAGTVSIAGTDYTGSGSFTAQLDRYESINIVLSVTIASVQNNASISITNLSLVADRDATTTFQKADGGSYTVTDAEGTAIEITADTQLTQHSSKAYTLSAEAAEGYIFFGWYNVTTDSYISYSADATYKSDADYTIRPVFISENTAVFETGSMKFTDLGEAAAYAENNGFDTIILVNSGTVSGDYTIPAGVTLLIPFDDANTCYTTTPGCVGTDWVRPTAYRTLTMASGSSITVNGVISVSAQHTAGVSAQGTDVSHVGSPSGPCGFIEMEENSEIIINGTGTLYAWGYITGEGSVTAKAGATVYENIQFTDFRGGSATLILAMGDYMNYGVFPLCQYYVQNVEVEMVLESGANEYVYTSLSMNNQIFSSGVKFIGSGAMFVANEGGAITKTYVPAKDRLQIDVVGGGAINSLSLELEGNSIDSSDYVLPITNNITINVLSGTTSINQDMALLPGSVVTIAEGAELIVSANCNLYIYDEDEWDKYQIMDENYEFTDASGGNYIHVNRKFSPVPYSPSRTYNRTNSDLTDVSVDVNGKLSVEGYVYTTRGGADVCTSAGTGLVHLITGLDPEYVDCMAVDFGWFTFQAIQSGSDVSLAFIPSTSIKLHNGNGDYTDTEDAVAGDCYYWNSTQSKWVKMTDAVVSFDANGADGTMSSITVTKQDILDGKNQITLTANSFIKEGYDFVGWAESAEGEVVYQDGDTVTVTSDITLYAVWEVKTYDVNFVSGDWSGSAIVEYGEDYTVPGQDGFVPALTKTGHTFQGWTTVENGTEVQYKAGDIISVTEDITLYAVWKANVYTVIWQNEDGTELEKDSVEYGKVPTYDGATPTKASDAQYTYTFKGWDKEITAVAGDATYTAVYDKTVNKYTVKFVNEDGTVLQETLVEYGTKPVYTGETPVKAPTAEYSYTFDRWTPEVVAVTGDAVYTAVYTEKVRTYTVTWIVDGKETTDEYEVGESIIVPADPSKEGYTFAGWDKAVPAAMPAEDLTFTAKWTVNMYTIKFVDEDGTVLQESEVAYGETPAYTGKTPVKEATVQYTYTFTGWTPEIVAVTGETTYTAVYEATVNKYTVKFVNEDGTELQKSEVAYGETPVYTGETPAKAATAQYTYTFAGWDKEIAAVTGNVTYTATYSETVNKYEVKFVDEDGTELQKSEVAYGETPVYTGETPAKAATAQYTYTFAGWTPEIVTVTGDAVYTAVYDAVVNKYTVKFVDEDGTVLQESKVAYGEMPSYTEAEPTKAATAEYTYTFTGWTPSVVTVTADATYTAVYKAAKNTYTVTWVNEDGTVLERDTVEYGVVPTYDGEEPVKANSSTSSFVFKGWDKEITAVTGDETYTAVYTEILKNGFYEENGGIYHYVDGYLSYAGLIYVDGYYYYVRTTTGEVVTDRMYWVTYTNDLMEEGNYWFDEQGRMIDAPTVEVKNGFYEENGGIYYYVDGELSYAGLIYVDGYYYYVRTTTGEVVTNRMYWVTYTNGLMDEGNYWFDEQGRMIDAPTAEVKNGFYEENGGIYYYVDGELSYAGLIYVDGYYYYVRTTTGEVVTNRMYWVTYTNGLMDEGNYYFDELGRMIDAPVPEVKNGFYEENGGIYHYADGELSYAGLIYVDGYYYYVRTTTSEVVCGRTYWVTYTNGLLEEGNYYFDEQGRMVVD